MELVCAAARLEMWHTNTMMCALHQRNSITPSNHPSMHVSIFALVKLKTVLPARTA